MHDTAIDTIENEWVMVRERTRPLLDQHLPCVLIIDHFTVVAKLPGLRMEARLPVTLF